MCPTVTGTGYSKAQLGLLFTPLSDCLVRPLFHAPPHAGHFYLLLAHVLYSAWVYLYHSEPLTGEQDPGAFPKGKKLTAAYCKSAVASGRRASLISALEDWPELRV